LEGLPPKIWEGKKRPKFGAISDNFDVDREYDEVTAMLPTLSKFLSQQWQLVNDSERTMWRMDLRQLTVYEHFGRVNMRAITYSFVDQSL